MFKSMDLNVDDTNMSELVEAHCKDQYRTELQNEQATVIQEGHALREKEILMVE